MQGARPGIPASALKKGPASSSAAPGSSDQTESTSDDVERPLRCGSCDAVVAYERDVFSMATEGPVAVFVNPGGFFHDIVTLRSVEGLTRVGPAVAKDSWFAGYTWTLCHCDSCGSHLGWQFDALGPADPSVFWALRRASICQS